MILKTITLKNDTSDSEYTEVCNICENQGVFHACGSPDDKWIMVHFENDVDYLAWCVAMGIAKIQEQKGDSNEV